MSEVIGRSVPRAPLVRASRSRPRFLHRALVAGVAALLSASLISSTAMADGRIGGPTELPAALGPGGLLSVRGLAVSQQEGGAIYVLDTGLNQRVTEFQPDGSFVRSFGWGVVPGAASGTGTLTVGSASITNVVTTQGAFGSGSFGGGKVITGPGIQPNTIVTEVNATEIKISKPATTSGSNVAVSVAEGAGNVPTNEVQRLVVKATGGQFKLKFTSLNPGSTTAETGSLPHNAGAAEVQAALEALATIGPGAVSVTGGPGDQTGSTPYVITFQGRWADTNVRPLVAVEAGLTGGSPASSASVETTREGAGVLETCTTACLGESFEEGSSESGSGDQPGQMSYSDEVSIDNDPSSSSYGDLYVVNERNFRVDKYSPSGEFLLMFGGEVDKTTGADVCTAADMAGGDECGSGVPGVAPGRLYKAPPVAGAPQQQNWSEEGHNSIAVAPDGTVWVGDFRRVQHFDAEGHFLGDLSMPSAGNTAFVTSLAVNTSGDVYANAPGANERQLVNLPASGTFALTFEGQTSAPLAADASADAVEAALEALSTIGPEDVHVESLSAAYQQVTFEGALGSQNLPLMTASNAAVANLIEGGAGQLVELGPGGELLQSFDPAGEPTHIGLGPSGNLIVSDRNDGNFIFREFEPSGTLIAAFDSDQVGNGEGLPRGIAVDGNASRIYASAGKPGGSSREPQESHIAIVPLPTNGPPAVSDESVSNVEPTTASVHVIVNPRGFDTKYAFEYVDQHSYESEGGFASVHTVQVPTPAVDLGFVNQKDPVVNAISGLFPGTVYHFRATATSSEGVTHGADESFETLPAVSIRNFTTQTVGPELVTLKAELDPNNSLLATHYKIRLGTDTTYSIGEQEGVLPSGSSDFAAKEVTFTGLQPNTLYHYQLVAENSYTAPGSPLKTADRVFTTEMSAAEEHSREDCPNTTRREENNSLRLSECRAYEQVSARFKAGNPAGHEDWVSATGDRIVYASTGAFSGAEQNELFVQYVAQRTVSGWGTQPVLGQPGAPGFQPHIADLFTPELDRWAFWEIEGQYLEGARNEAKLAFYSLGEANGEFRLHASPPLEAQEGAARFYGLLTEVRGQSDDLSRLFIPTASRLLPSDPRPDDFLSSSINHSRVYEASGVGSNDPQLKLIAEVPLGLTDESCEIDERGLGSVIPVRYASADGLEYFYKAPIEAVPGAKCGPGTPNPIALFVRDDSGSVDQLNVAPPAQCSAPHPCATGTPDKPTFFGVSPDGSFAWFTTAQPLIDSDTDQTSDLYLAKLEAGHLKELVQASGGGPSDPTPGTGAELESRVHVSRSETAAAFIASGVLTTAPNGSGESAGAGARNLYVYDAIADQVRFVARLCSGPQQSGAVADPRCPESLESEGPMNDRPLWEIAPGAELALTPDGRFAVFSSYGRLTADDTDGALDVYRYDTATGALERVSIGRNGNDGNGNDDSYPATATQASGLLSTAPYETAEDFGRAISTDGSVVVFRTAAPLVSFDTNTGDAPGCGSRTTGCDVYEWTADGHGECQTAGGCVALVSDGVDRHGTFGGNLSASGRDITFYTSHGLVSGDTDGIGDIYDARVGGGFPAFSLPPECEGAEGCRGVTPPAPPSPALTTAENHSGGNGPQTVQCAKGKKRVKKHGQVRCVAKSHRQHKHRQHTNTRNGGKGK